MFLFCVPPLHPHSSLSIQIQEEVSGHSIIIFSRIYSLPEADKTVKREGVEQEIINEE